MILSQILGDEFHRLSEDDLNRLNTAVSTELIRSAEVHKALDAKVRAAHTALRK